MVFKKGITPWNKGKPNPIRRRLNFIDNPSKRLDVRKKQSEIRKKLLKEGKIKPWNKGKPWSEEARAKMSKAQKGKIHRGSFKKGHIVTKEIREKIGKANKSKKHPWLAEHNKTPEFRERMSKLRKGNFMGKENPNWRGGLSFEPYGLEFNEKLKEQIRKRDNYRCRECFMHQNKLKRKLHIHHIDYNKKNNYPNNLISLCVDCHAQTNFKREDWIGYFRNKINEFTQ